MIPHFQQNSNIWIHSLNRFRIPNPSPTHQLVACLVNSCTRPFMHWARNILTKLEGGNVVILQDRFRYAAEILLLIVWMSMPQHRACQQKVHVRMLIGRHAESVEKGAVRSGALKSKLACLDSSENLRLEVKL
jgi:hypothetical protein